MYNIWYELGLSNNYYIELFISYTNIYTGYLSNINLSYTYNNHKINFKIILIKNVALPQ